MASRREERMQQRMRGAQRHQLQDASFDLFLSLPETIGESAESLPRQNTKAGPGPAIVPSSASRVRTTPNSSTKRRRLSGGGPGVAGVSVSDKARETSHVRRLSSSPVQAVEEEVGESPADAPGSGRRRSVNPVDGTAASGRTLALQQLFSNTDSSRSTRSRTAKMLELASPSSPSAARAAKRQPVPMQKSRSPPGQRSETGEALEADELSPELSTLINVSLKSGKAATGISSAIGSKTRNPQQPETNTRAKGDGGTMVSKLAKPKHGGSADAVDELSSPVLSIILDSSPNYLMTSSIAASSSPLARKSAVGTRAARNTRSVRTSRLYIESRASDAATPQAAEARKKRGSQTSPDEELDELSPEQSSVTTLPQPSTRRAIRPSRREATKPPSSVLASRPIERVPPQAARLSALSGQPSTTMPSNSNRRSPRLSNGQETSAGLDKVNEENEENEEAEEINALEAAKVIGRKRPRRSPVRAPSPELGSEHSQTGSASQPAAIIDADGNSTPARQSRRQRLQEQSVASQNQQRLAKSTKQPAKRKRRRAADDSGAEVEDDGSQGEEVQEGSSRAAKTSRRGPPVPIVVQRYSQFGRNSRRSRAGSAASDDENFNEVDEGDELAATDADIAFANRSGVNAVDVLAQICEDIVEQKLQTLQEKHRQARQQQLEAAEGDKSEAAAMCKEIIVSRRALESFQQELRARLLTQAVAVDALHALRKRVSAAHKEKLALRQEILRIRAERDQVALRMDALRAQHHERVHEAMKTATISATMHDIDLAVEQGRAAPELTATQQKAADLANLELIVRQVIEQVSGGSRSSHNGGTLQQITDFNDFLERTATVLEGRKMSARAVVV